MHRRLRLRCIVAFVVALSGCATIDPFSEPPTSAVSAQPFSGHFNATDVVFLHAMIAHQRTGLMLAELGLDPIAEGNDAVVRIAQHLVDEDNEHIERMTEWLRDWNQPTDQPPTATVDDDGRQLAGLRGAEFDRRWIDTMTAHHRSAVSLAEMVQLDGASRDVANFTSGLLVDLAFELGRLDTAVSP